MNIFQFFYAISSSKSSNVIVLLLAQIMVRTKLITIRISREYEVQ